MLPFLSLEASNLVQETMLLQKGQLHNSNFLYQIENLVSPPFRTATLVENETMEGQRGEGCLARIKVSLRIKREEVMILSSSCDRPNVYQQTQCLRRRVDVW